MRFCAKIPFNFTQAVTEIYRKSIPDRFHEEAGDISLKVEEDIFGAVCGCLLEEEDIVKVNLFMFHQILQACLSSKKCPSCEKQFYLEIFLLCLKYWKTFCCHEILRCIILLLDLKDY